MSKSIDYELDWRLLYCVVVVKSPWAIQAACGGECFNRNTVSLDRFLSYRPWSLASTDVGGGGVWEPWVYFWLLGAETVGEGINIVWRRSEVLARDKCCMDFFFFLNGWFVYCCFMFLPFGVGAFKGPLCVWDSFGGHLRSLLQPFSSLSFCVCVQISNSLTFCGSWFFL